MRVLTQREVQSWLEDHGAGRISSHIPASEFPFKKSYGVADNTGKKTALARVLSFLAEEDPSGLFWITNSGIWPSSENVDLFMGYRRGLGEHRSLRDAPGHIFEPSDRATLQSLLCISLYFYWDALLLSGSRRLIVKISHDEVIDIHAQNDHQFREMDILLTKLGLNPVIGPRDR